MRASTIIIAFSVVLLLGAVSLNVLNFTGNPVVRPPASSAPALSPGKYIHSTYSDVTFYLGTEDLREVYNNETLITCPFYEASSVPVVKIESNQSILQILKKANWKHKLILGDTISNKIYIAYEDELAYIIYEANSSTGTRLYLAGTFEKSRLRTEQIFGKVISYNASGMTLGMLVNTNTSEYQLLTTFNNDGRTDNKDNDDFLMNWRNDRTDAWITSKNCKGGAEKFYNFNMMGVIANVEEPNDVIFGAVTASRGWSGIGTRNTDGQNKLGMVILWPEMHCANDRAAFRVPA